jgi:hypothetical protein
MILLSGDEALAQGAYEEGLAFAASYPGTPATEILEYLAKFDESKDRLLFGTDFPLIDQKQDIDLLKDIALPKELQERTFFRNAQELLGLGVDLRCCERQLTRSACVLSCVLEETA